METLALMASVRFLSILTIVWLAAQARNMLQQLLLHGSEWKMRVKNNLQVLAYM